MSDIRLDLQERIFWYAAQNGLKEQMHDLIEDRWDELLDLMVERLRGGYRSYGSAMYGWTPQVRLKNALEEAADMGVYLSSGDV
jgi:hypothetical protein